MFADYKVGESDIQNKYAYTHIYQFRVAANDDVIQGALKKGYLFEKYNNMIACSLIKPGDNVIDVGANIGTMTVPFARSVGPEGKVFSFEPFPRTRGYLIHNVKTNDAKNVRVYATAVGHMITDTSLSNNITNIERFKGQFSGKKGNSVMIGDKKMGSKTLPLDTKHTTNFGGIRLGMGGPKVKMVTLDSIKFPHIHFLKVDVEGAEPLVFYGGQNTIRKYKPIIMFEYNWVTLTDEVQSAVPKKIQQFDIFKFCRSLGYDTIIESDREDYIIIPSGRKRTFNDPMVVWKRVNRLPALKNFDISGFSLFKFQIPKWT